MILTNLTNSSSQSGSLSLTVYAWMITCDLGDRWYYNPVHQSCIKRFLLSVNRATAQANCQAEGASLAMWDTPETVELFSNLMTNSRDGTYKSPL